MPDHTEDRRGPLRGVRVIDVTRWVPGAYCTMLLADLGAEIVRVRSRGSTPSVPAAFMRGKTCVTLDLKDDLGRSALRRLACGADVFVEDARPGAAGRLGVGYDDLVDDNAGLVYCSLTSFGQHGPRAAEASHDLNVLALSGVLGALGPSDRPPLPPLNLVADIGSGSVVAAFGIVAALFARASSGRGSFVDAAMLDGCISAVQLYRDVWKTPAMPARGLGVTGGASPYYRAYQCADGRHVALAAWDDRARSLLWKILGLPGVPPDQDDVHAWSDATRQLTTAFQSKGRDDWAALFEATGAGVSSVLDIDEVTSDEHVRNRLGENLESLVVPRVGPGPFIRAPLALGDATAEVLAAAGASPGELRSAVAAAEEQSRAEPTDPWPFRPYSQKS